MMGIMIQTTWSGRVRKAQPGHQIKQGPRKYVGPRQRTEFHFSWVCWTQSSRKFQGVRLFFFAKQSQQQPLNNGDGELTWLRRLPVAHRAAGYADTTLRSAGGGAEQNVLNQPAVCEFRQKSGMTQKMKWI